MVSCMKAEGADSGVRLLGLKLQFRHFATVQFRAHCTLSLGFGFLICFPLREGLEILKRSVTFFSSLSPSLPASGPCTLRALSSEQVYSAYNSG